MNKNMKRLGLGVSTIAVALLAAPVLTVPVSPAMAQPADEEMPEYRPPPRGTPGSRMGGGSRGNEKFPSIAALVPDHAGLTLKDKPVLFWWSNGDTDKPVEFALIDFNAEETVVRTKLPGPVKAGWQRIDLSAMEGFGGLKADVPYQWKVQLLPTEPGSRRSDGPVASGMILRTAVPADGASTPAALARGGIWYDALDAVMRQLDAGGEPAERARKSLASLLRQVNLEEPAKFAETR